MAPTALEGWLGIHEKEYAGPSEPQVRIGGEILTDEAERFLKDPYDEGGALPGDA